MTNSTLPLLAELKNELQQRGAAVWFRTTCEPPRPSAPAPPPSSPAPPPSAPAPPPGRALPMMDRKACALAGAEGSPLRAASQTYAPVSEDVGLLMVSCLPKLWSPLAMVTPFLLQVTLSSSAGL